MAPDSGSSEQDAPTERSVRRPRKRGGRRGQNVQIIGRINARARVRQEAWAAEHDLSLEEFKEVVRTGQRDLTRAMTSKLDRDFDELREANASRREGPS